MTTIIRAFCLCVSEHYFWGRGEVIATFLLRASLSFSSSHMPWSSVRCKAYTRQHVSIPGHNLLSTAPRRFSWLIYHHAVRVHDPVGRHYWMCRRVLEGELGCELAVDSTGEVKSDPLPIKVMRGMKTGDWANAEANCEAFGLLLNHFPLIISVHLERHWSSMEKKTIPCSSSSIKALIPLSHQHSMRSTLKNLLCFAIFSGYFCSGLASKLRRKRCRVAHEVVGNDAASLHVLSDPLFHSYMRNPTAVYT